MMWHTSLLSKISLRTQKIISMGLLAIALMGSGVFACIGGDAGGGGGTSIGSGGGAGAPPVAIPAPEALNMTGVTISASDNSGNVTVIGVVGAALPNADVRIRNIGPQVAWYQKAFVSSAYAAIGDEVIVKANALGAFGPVQIKALTGDGIALSQKVGLTPGSIEIYGAVPAFGVTNPNLVVPATQQKSFIKSKGALDSTGHGWIIQSSSKKWKWMDLLISNAHAADDMIVQNVSEVNCSQVGPCQTKPSTAPHEGYAPLSKLDPNGEEQLALQVPYAKDVNGIMPAVIKGPPDQQFIGIAAGKNAIILKEVSPEKWAVQEVLRLNTAVTGVQSDVQASDLFYYFSTEKGFVLYNVKTRAVSFFATKVGLMSELASVLPTAFTKKGSHIVYASWINNQAWLAQGDLSADPTFTLQRVLTSSIYKPISEIQILEMDVNKSIDLPSGRISYRVNEIAFISGRNLYFMEVPTNASYSTLVANLMTHPDLDMAKVEKTLSIALPEGTKDLSMMAYNPDQTLVAVSDGDKVYYVDWTFGETIALQAVLMNKKTDLRTDGAGPAAVLLYNPVSKNFILRGLSENISLGSGQISSNSVSASPRVISISVSDRSVPEAPLRMTPRESATTRDQAEITVRSTSVRSNALPVSNSGLSVTPTR